MLLHVRLCSSPVLFCFFWSTSYIPFQVVQINMLLCLVTVTIGHWYYSDSLLIIVAKLLGCFRHSTGRMLSQCRVLFSNLVAFFTVSVLKIFCNLEIYIEWLELWFISLLNLQRQKGKRKLQFELAQIPVHFNIFLGPTSIILIVLKVSVLVLLRYILI